MGNALRARKHGLFLEELSVAAEAVLLGCAHEGHWETLAAFVQRQGIDCVLQTLTRERRAAPSREWWRQMLLLSVATCGSRSADQHGSQGADQAVRLMRNLIAIERSGGGPAFDVERHALLVSSAVRYLQSHLARVYAGDARAAEIAAVGEVVDAARVAGVKGR